MSSAASIDIRLPIGGLFTALGLVLTIYGVATNGDAVHYAPSGNVNVNLYWGIVMLVFGALFLWLGSRASPRAGAHPAMTTPEGRATEALEHREGLERERR
jgi:hypothetical protein